MCDESHLSDAQFAHHVKNGVVVPPDYDDDPNNWTARIHRPSAFAKNALRPIFGMDDPRSASEPGGYP